MHIIESASVETTSFLYEDQHSQHGTSSTLQSPTSLICRGRGDMELDVDDKEKLNKRIRLALKFFCEKTKTLKIVRRPIFTYYRDTKNASSVKSDTIGNAIYINMDSAKYIFSSLLADHCWGLLGRFSMFHWRCECCAELYPNVG